MHHCKQNPLVEKKPACENHLTPSTLLLACLPTQCTILGCRLVQCVRGCHLTQFARAWHQEPTDEIPEKPPSLSFSILLRKVICFCRDHDDVLEKKKETLVDLSVQFDFVKTFQSELDQTWNFRPELFSQCVRCSKTLQDTTYAY